jgi:hypothetical protein
MPATSRSRGRRLLGTLVTYTSIIAVTLLLIDVTCMVTGIFPPSYNYGDPDIGWRPAPATGHMDLGRCFEASTRQVIDYDRNEDGIRTSQPRAQILADTASFKLAITGDSHSDLCLPNRELHGGVLEAGLKAQGVPAVALNYGTGKFSPLQNYLAYRTVLKPYGPRVFVMNLYTGNDFNDILRIDDRPHFQATSSGYRIAPPIWYSMDDPSAHYRSRVLFAARKLGNKIGVRQMYLRLSQLREAAAQQGGSMLSVMRYLADLGKAREKAVGYPDAFTAQMLNQQLFFHYFPGSKAESLRRIRALMAMVRTENPGLILVMSPLPSYQLTGEQPVDSAFLRTLRRLPTTYDSGVAEEKELYEQLRQLSAETGWLFVDNLAALQAYSGKERLYNDYDYHLLPTASVMIGKLQAAVLLDTLRSLKRGPHTRR